MLGGVSLFKTNFLTWKFVGMDNYLKAFERGYIRPILNSLLYLFLIPLPGTFISMFIAVSISDLLKRTQAIIRSLYYIPMFSAGIISALFWRWFFGKGEILIGPWGVPAISIIIITSTLGPQMLLFSLAIQNQNPDIIEAGKIDGASPFQIKMMLVLPQLWRLFSVILLFSMVGALQIWETIYMLAPFDNTASMMFKVFSDGFLFGRYGLASAECIIMVIVILVIGLTKQRIERKETK